MRLVKAACSLTLVVAILGTAFGVSVASAHTASTHYPVEWPAGTDVFYRFTAEYPSGNFRSRVTNAAAQWNAQGGTAEVDFFAAGGADHPNFAFPTGCSGGTSTLGARTLHYEDLDSIGSGVLGATLTCFNTSTAQIVTFHMAIDNDRDWYTGTGDANDGFLQTCVPSCQDDLWSVLSHEFGHATGFIGPSSTGGHFAESDAACPESDARNTMCPSIAPGTERMRTLEGHDIHTFTNAY